MSTNDEFIEVLYNNCYGGWGVSEQAINLYNNRMKEIDPNHVSIEDSGDLWSNRHDPVLVKIFHELGDAFNESRYNCSKIAIIPKKYENCYIIKEYDGLESIQIDKNKYKLDMIRQMITNDTMTSDEKINELKILFNNVK